MKQITVAIHGQKAKIKVNGHKVLPGLYAARMLDAKTIWALTHEKSGRAVLSFINTKKQAQEIAEKFFKDIDWEQDADKITVSQDIKDCIMQARSYLNDHYREY